jgi:hypothetical protein
MHAAQLLEIRSQALVRQIQLRRNGELIAGGECGEPLVCLAMLSQVWPGGSLTRTPPCTGLRPPDIITPARDRPVRQIPALCQQRLLARHDLGLHGLIECFDGLQGKRGKGAVGGVGRERIRRCGEAAAIAPATTGRARRSHLGMDHPFRPSWASARFDEIKCPDPIRGFPGQQNFCRMSSARGLGRCSFETQRAQREEAEHASSRRVQRSMPNGTA